MNNPNAIATLTVGSVMLSLEQLGERYVDVHLGPFWGRAAIVAATTAVIYIGRDGLRGCLRRLAATLKGVWTGRPPAAATPAKDAAAK